MRKTAEEMDEVQRLRAERDEAQAKYRFMVERAADQKLDGYRELGARAAAAENEVEKLRKELEAAKAERNLALHQVSQLKHERRMLRRRLVEARKWVGFCPILPEGIRELCLVRDLMDDTLDEVQE